MKTYPSIQCNPLSFFKKNKKFTKHLSMFLSLAFMHLIVGCSYYNVRDVSTTPETMAAQIVELNKSLDYIIVHTGEKTWHLGDVQIDIDNKLISGNVQVRDNLLHPVPIKRVNQYHKKKQTPLNELHFYSDSIAIPEVGSQISIPISDINTVSVNDKNSGRSFANIFLGTVGVVAAVIIIVLLTKSSCPFIYVKNAEEFVFVGELYPGIITPNLQTDDFIALPSVAPDNDEYNIMITNELKEIQHTDMVQLISIDHPENVAVLLDNKGNPYSFSSILSPNNVLLDNYKIDLEPVMKKDNNSYLFDTQIDYSNSVRNIEIEFDKPVDQAKAKLYLTAKNSLWLDYIFGRLNEQFGSKYNEFQIKQQRESKEQSINWINDQHIPLSVYVNTTKGWELVDRINTVGPMAYRDLVVPIDLSHVSGHSLKIKLETGFMFWELDYAGIDYSENLPLSINYMETFKAIDQDNNDVTDLLVATDNNYLIQPNVGDKVVVTFESRALDLNLKRSLFLKNRGYYNYIRDYTGKPEIRKLKLFEEPGAFTDFSRYEFEAFMEFEKQHDLALNQK